MPNIKTEQRDLTRKQAHAKLLAYGFKPDLLGYWTVPGTSYSVNWLNGGQSYRARIAYMLDAKERLLAKVDKP